MTKLDIFFVNIGGKAVRRVLVSGPTDGGGPTEPPVNPPPPGGSRDDLVLGTYKPDATTTGLLPGVALTPMSGTTTYSVSGTASNWQLVENKQFNGPVVIACSYIKFKNCWFRASPTANGEAIKAYGSTTHHVLLEDCLLKPQAQSGTFGGGAPIQYNVPCFKGGYETTLNRCEVTGGIDGIAYINSQNDYAGTQNFNLYGNWFHDMILVSPDPGAAGGVYDNQGHVDLVQLRGGRGFHFKGNTFDGHLRTDVGQGGVFTNDQYEWTIPGDNTSAPKTNSKNAALGQGILHNGGNRDYVMIDSNGDHWINSPPIGQPQTQAAWNTAHAPLHLKFPLGRYNATTSVIMFSPPLGPFRDFVIENNWIDGGTWSLNIPPSADVDASVQIINNKIGRMQQSGPTNGLVIVNPAKTLTMYGNTYEDDGTPANTRKSGG